MAPSAEGRPSGKSRTGSRARSSADQQAEVPRGARRLTAPDRGESGVGEVAALDGAPEDLREVGAQGVAHGGRRDPAELSCAVAECVHHVRGQDRRQRRARRELAQDLAEPQPGGAGDRVHAHQGQAPADVDRVEDPLRDPRQLAGEGGEEAGPEEVVPGGVVQLVPPLPPETGVRAQLGAHQRDVRLRAVRADDEGTRVPRDAAEPERLDVEGRPAIDRHPQTDRVVQRG